MLAMAKNRYICKGKLHVWTGAYSRDAVQASGMAGLPKPFGTQSVALWVPDASSHGAAKVGVCSPAFGLALIVFFAITAYFPVGMGVYILNTRCCKYVTLLFDCIGAYTSEIY